MQSPVVFVLKTSSIDIKTHDWYNLLLLPSNKYCNLVAK